MTIIIRSTPPKAPKKPARKTKLPPHLRDVYMFAAKHLNARGEYVLPRAVMAKEFGIDETTVGRRINQLERWHAIRKTLTGWDARHRRLIVHFVLRNATEFLQPRRKDALSKAPKHALSSPETCTQQTSKDALSMKPLSANTHSGQVVETKPVSDVEKHAECVHACYNYIRPSIDNMSVVNRVIELSVNVNEAKTHSAPTEPSVPESLLDKARRELAKIEADRTTVSNPNNSYWTERVAAAKAEIARLEGLR